MQLIIANKNYSSWSLRAWLVLKASGLPFEEVSVALNQADTRLRILAYCPSAKLPCLIDDGLAIWDSLAIAEYIAEKCPVLWPKEAKARATARSISAEMHSGFLALRNHMSMNIRKDYRGLGRLPEVEDDIKRITDIWNDCRTRFGADGGPYLFGNYTIADMMFAPVCFRFATYGVEPAGEASEYMAAMLLHPHMEEWRKAALAENDSIPHYDIYG